MLPKPLKCMSTARSRQMSFSLARRSSPRANSASAAAASKISPMATMPPAIVMTLLLKVPEWIKSTGPVAVEKVHHVGATAEGAEAHAAGHVLAKRCEVRCYAAELLQATRGVPAGHHLVKHQEDARSRAWPARNAARNSGGRRYAAARAHHRLENDGGDVAGMRAKNLDVCSGVVVVGQRDRYRRIDRASATDECQQSAVVSASKGKHRRGDRRRLARPRAPSCWPRCRCW